MSTRYNNGSHYGNHQRAAELRENAVHAHLSSAEVHEKVLTAQEAAASGGAFGYVVNGRMIGGFALAAWPAEYGVSGIRTFTINREGDVYERDLGPSTAGQARRMAQFNPDQSKRPLVLE